MNQKRKQKLRKGNRRKSDEPEEKIETKEEEIEAKSDEPEEKIETKEEKQKQNLMNQKRK